jgi:hypothetical protein
MCFVVLTVQTVFALRRDVSCLLGFWRVQREELHNKGGRKRIRRKSKEINNFEERRHKTLRKKGANG